MVHLTDVHLRPKWIAENEQVLDRIARNPPDLVLVTGDLIEHKFDPQWSLPTLERFLGGLRSRLGTFAILGNHDGDLLGPYVTRFGGTLINDRYVVLEVDGGTRIELIGIPGVKRYDVGDSVLPRRVPSRSDRTLRILLSHYPDTVRELSHLQADVMLAGHTHGGQCCLPGGVPIITHDDLPRRYASGVHRFGETWLVVGRGFGFATWRFRVFCPSEVVELTLRSA